MMKPEATKIDIGRILKILPKKFQPGTEEYFLNGFYLARINQYLGGIPAHMNHNFEESIHGLVGLGWSEYRISEAIEKEFSKGFE